MHPFQKITPSSIYITVHLNVTLEKASVKAKQKTESVSFTTSSLKNGPNSGESRKTTITNFHTSNPFPLGPITFFNLTTALMVSLINAA